MILDIITAALIVIPMGIGMARGFLYIVVRLLGWFGALAGGFFLMPTARDLLQNSFVGQHVNDVLTEHFESTAGDVTTAADGLPAILSGAINETVQNTTELMVQALRGLILSVIAFLAIVILIRLLLISVIRPLSKRKGKSPVSFVNKLLGMLVGGVEGLALAFLFLAALMPVMQMSSPDTAASIAEALRFSYLAGSLYDGNLLLVMFS